TEGPAQRTETPGDYVNGSQQILQCGNEEMKIEKNVAPNSRFRNGDPCIHVPCRKDKHWYPVDSRFFRWCHYADQSILCPIKITLHGVEPGKVGYFPPGKNAKLLGNLLGRPCGLDDECPPRAHHPSVLVTGGRRGPPLSASGFGAATPHTNSR